MSLGLQLVMTTALVAAAPGCSWTHPGANPYRDDPVHALRDFALPDDTRRKLRTLMVAHRYTDVVTITRDDIVGARGYAELREMHSGRGRVCHGIVDRSTWPADRSERGLVYCVDATCVIVPTICNNVSLVSRKPESAAALPPDEGPIDVTPAAGPPAAPPDAPAAAPPDGGPLDFAPGDGGGGLPAIPDMPGGGTGGGGAFPSLPGGELPPGGNDTPCCIGRPGTPGAPIGPPPVAPTAPVREPPASITLLAGLASLTLLSLAGRRVPPRRATNRRR